jgi:2-oxoglutarate dehydrogenase E2 component (dihydrolipoamide succinyltransferase)
MAFEIVMPEVGLKEEGVTLLRWIKRKGDTVEKDEPVAEIETDKGTIEVDAGVPGRLAELLVREGEEVAAGSVIGWIVENSAG